jgi:hypothetical protein
MKRVLGNISMVVMILLLFHSAAHAYKLPDTGQAKCYNTAGTEISCGGTGQDGDYSINPMSYTDNGDGTVTDDNTGLMWKKQDEADGYNWYRASGTYDMSYNPTSQSACGELNTGGYSDWRLPTKKELMSIVDYSIPSPGPVMNIIYFTNTNTSIDYWSTRYWTMSTLAPDYPADAFHVEFSAGGVNNSYRYTNARVRCVRGIQSPAPAFIDNLNGTVTDNTTGLTWQQEDQSLMLWNSALSYCEGLSLGGHTDWRLPNVKEIESLTDDTRISPAIDSIYFPNYYWGGHRTSTTVSTETGFSWGVVFNYGGIGMNDKSGNTYVRCVRGGPCYDPMSCAFPESFLKAFGKNIQDIHGTDDYVYTMDVFEGVASYLNSASDGCPNSTNECKNDSGSYYQCTEYVARYLYSKFDTDYTDNKDLTPSSPTQGFQGKDFHPNFGSTPTVDKGGKTISLQLVSEPRTGDIAMFTSGHAAVVKRVKGTTATLIEQNFVSKAHPTYRANRAVSTSTPELAFYRYGAAVIKDSNTPHTYIQDAYNSVATNGQSIMTQSVVFKENIYLTNDISIKLQGGYDSDFLSATGWTSINGQMTISSGTVSVDRICIK